MNPIRVFSACVFVALGLTSATTLAEPTTTRPNLIFILIDNCGQEWFGCYGSEEGCTPNIDRLAREGLRVEHCYAPPVCGPSRIVALTGRYLLRSGMILHHDAALYSGGGFDPQKEITAARLLREAGYETALAGKWQINNLYDEPDVLKRHGFDESLVWPGSIDRAKVPPSEWKQFEQAIVASDVAFTSRFISNIESRYWDPVLLRSGQRDVLAGRFGPDVFQEFVIDFLRRPHDRPFFLYYPMVLTHGQSFTEHVVPTPLNRDRNRSQQDLYADMVRYADRLVGQVIKELERTGLRDRTIVFVATDNGTEKSIAARCRGRQIQGGLYELSEAGSDVPLIVNSPRMVPGGRTLNLADFSDLLPTFCELTGAQLPPDRVIDGRSFAGVVRGHSDRGPRQWMFNQYGATRVVRNDRYKLYSDGRMFDVQSDFEERENLAQSREQAITEAKRQLQAVLNSFPPDSPPPFELRSQSAFKLKEEARRKR